MARSSFQFGSTGLFDPTQKIAAIDVKTTGLSRRVSRPIELGAALIDPTTGQITETFSTLVNPGMAHLFRPRYRTRAALAGLPLGDITDPRTKAALIPGVARALGITGITPQEILERGVSPRRATRQLSIFFKRHGITQATSFKTAFDRPFIQKAGITGISFPVDLLHEATQMAGEMGMTPWLTSKGRYRWVSAERAGKIFLDPTFKQAQRAEADAILSARLFKKFFLTASRRPSVARPSTMKFSSLGKIAAGLIGAGALAAFATRETQNEFSARDDNYNTIEGMSEQGMAASIRHMSTNFGSGYTGLEEQEPDPLTQVAEVVVPIIEKRPLPGFILSILSKLGIHIPGKDDNYNTIEGMRHGGISEHLRQNTTDFGSGYTGLLNALLKQRRMTVPVLKKLLPEGTEHLVEYEIGKHGKAFITSTVRRGEQELFRSERIIDEVARTVHLEKIELAESLQGRGLYKKIVEAEKEIFQHVGMSGWSVTSVVTNPITERKIVQLYGAARTGKGLWVHGLIPPRSNIAENEIEKSILNAIIPEARSNLGQMAGSTVSRVHSYKSHRIRKLVMAEQQRQTQQAVAINGLKGGQGHIIQYNKRLHD